MRQTCVTVVIAHSDRKDLNTWELVHCLGTAIERKGRRLQKKQLDRFDSSSLVTMNHPSFNPSEILGVEEEAKLPYTTSTEINLLDEDSQNKSQSQGQSSNMNAETRFAKTDTAYQVLPDEHEQRASDVLKVPRHPQQHDPEQHLPPQHLVPDSPGKVSAIDPITSAYQAGKVDAIAEQFSERISSSVSPRPVIIERIIERPTLERVIERPTTLLSYSRLPEHPRFTESHHLEDTDIDGIRSHEDDHLTQKLEVENETSDWEDVPWDTSPDLDWSTKSSYGQEVIARPEIVVEESDNNGRGSSSRNLGSCSVSTLESLEDRQEQLEVPRVHELVVSFHPTPCLLDGCRGAYTFKTYESYRSHLKNVHTKDIYCPVPGCRHHYARPFATKNDLVRHYRARHDPDPVKPFRCERIRCAAKVKAWSHKEKLRQHDKRYHMNLLCHICSHYFDDFEELSEHTKFDHGWTGQEDLSPAESEVESDRSLHEDEKIGPMGELQKQLLLTTLRTFARTDGPLGQKEQGWELLRENLVREHNHEFLDQHSATILSLWYDCIEEAKNLHPKAASSHRALPDAEISDSIPIASMQEEDARSEISRSSSIASITDSIFSMMSGSSMSSIGGSQEANERLILLLLGDEEIQALCEQAVQTILPERFERNLRRLLKAFAAELKQEAQNPSQRQAANFVRLRARNSAHSIRNSLNKDKHPPIAPNNVPLTSISGHVEAEPEEESDESDGAGSGDEPDDLDNLEQFIKSSNAMGTLRRSLRVFIFPTKEEHSGPQGISEENSIIQIEEGDASLSKEQVIDITEATNDQNDNIVQLAPKQETEPIIDDEAGSSEDTERVDASQDVLHHEQLWKKKSTSYPKEIAVEPRYRQSLVEHVQSKALKFAAWLGMLLLGTSHLTRRSAPPDGKTRIKWKCRCGHQICDDFVELEPGAAERYKQSRERMALLCQYKKSAARSPASQPNVPSRLHSFIPPPSRRTHRRSIFFCALALDFAVFFALNFSVLPLWSLIRPTENGPITSWMCCYQTVALFLFGVVLLLSTAWFINKIYISKLSQSKSLKTDVQDKSHPNGDARKSSFITSITKLFGQASQLFWRFIQVNRGTATEEDSGLPRFNNLDEVAPPSGIPVKPSSELLFLLLCYNEGRYATRLLQLGLVKLQATSDKVLFKLLRANYKSMRGNWVSWCSLRTLSWIKFVHFEMYKSELVDVRKTDDIPPPDHVEYRYMPAPPDLVPPVGDKHMMHLFQNPDCAEDEALCVSRFPKKLKEKLKCNGGVNSGWGLQFVEGWDWRKIWLIVFAFFGLGSLLIGVLWARFEHSIQDAFAIAAYMIAFATVTIGMVQAAFLM